ANGYDRNSSPSDEYRDSRFDLAERSVSTSSSLGKQGDDSSVFQPAKCFLEPRGSHSVALDREPADRLHDGAEYRDEKRGSGNVIQGALQRNPENENIEIAEVIRDEKHAA